MTGVGKNMYTSNVRKCSVEQSITLAFHFLSSNKILKSKIIVKDTWYIRDPLIAQISNDFHRPVVFFTC